MKYGDLLDARKICEGLKTEIVGRSVQCFDVLDSTNAYARKTAEIHFQEGMAIIADAQTSGRGRMGREWNSLPGAGIWMSIILKPSLIPEKLNIISLGAAVSVVLAVMRATGIAAGIKWPNDIVLGGRKVCGILAEMSSGIDKVDFLVLGIGINVNQDTLDFPDYLRNTAVSLKVFAEKTGMPAPEPGFDRNGLIREVLLELDRIYKMINEGKNGEIIEEWRRQSATLGKKVRVCQGEREYAGTAVDVTEEGRLVVECNDGSMLEFISGEVSVRGMCGYI